MSRITKGSSYNVIDIRNFNSANSLNQDAINIPPITGGSGQMGPLEFNY